MAAIQMKEGEVTATIYGMVSLSDSSIFALKCMVVDDSGEKRI